MKIPLFKILKRSRVLLALGIFGGLIVLVGGTSAYAAHSNALPGNALYPFKQLWEEGSVALSFSPASNAQAHLNIVRDRLSAVQASSTPTPVLAPTMKTVQQNLTSALTQSNNVTDQTQRKEIKKSISDAAAEAEVEAEQNKSESDSSSSDSQDIQSSSDQIKRVQDQASTDD